MAEPLLVFVGVAAVVIIMPGPDTALVTKNALLHGRRAALCTTLGIAGGLAIWTVASALGVASLVRASATAFDALKLIGAGYLIWLGVQALRAAGRRSAGAGVQDDASAFRGRDGFRQGVVGNLSNPKIAAFFTSLLPQFIGTGRSLLVGCLALGGVFVLMTIAWLGAYALAAARASAWLRRPRVKAAMDRVTGLVLIGFGLRLVTERR
jgi:RhtB (resistance to homoserine/threonine) family protein